MDAPPAILWFRRDLRLDDNPALVAAAASGRPVIPVYVHDPESDGAWAPGSATLWWLHHSLQSLQEQLRGKASRLVLRRGPVRRALLAVVEQTRAFGVFWNRQYEPASVALEARVERALKALGRSAESFPGNLLYEPGRVLTRSGTPYQIFTPFWEACTRSERPGAPLPAPPSIPAPERWPESDSLDSWELTSPRPSASALPSAWRPGEPGARSSFDRFLRDSAALYESRRDRPDLPGTSRLSPHLHFGEISVRRIRRCLVDWSPTPTEPRVQASVDIFLRELGWREFAHHLLFHFPKTPDRPLRKAFDQFPWLRDERALEAWREGRTGYPIVDAGMRQLLATGWMHNRVRMIVASFLVKDLLISWNPGARWFWDQLVDADLANNTLGWQWSAGCGADAAPYFRIFNPVRQGQKFDPGGDYVKQWVPELTNLPAKWLHSPWQTPSHLLAKAGVEIGRTYPEPIVDHAERRRLALQAFASVPKTAPRT